MNQQQVTKQILNRLFLLIRISLEMICVLFAQMSSQVIS